MAMQKPALFIATVFLSLSWCVEQGRRHSYTSLVGGLIWRSGSNGCCNLYRGDKREWRKMRQPVDKYAMCQYHHCHHHHHPHHDHRRWRHRMPMQACVGDHDGSDDRTQWSKAREFKSSSKLRRFFFSPWAGKFSNPHPPTLPNSPTIAKGCGASGQLAHGSFRYLTKTTPSIPCRQ